MGWRFSQQKDVIHVPTHHCPPPPEVLKHGLCQTRCPEWAGVQSEGETQHLHGLVVAPHPHPPLGLRVEPQMEKPVFEVQGNTPMTLRVVLQCLEYCTPMVSFEPVQSIALVQRFQVCDNPDFGGMGLLSAKGVYPTSGVLGLQKG